MKKQDKKEAEILLTFWERLFQVKQLSFHATSKVGIGWVRKGKGKVAVTKENENELIFHGKGVWLDEQGVEVDFSNVFRWTLDCQVGVISLEHLRLGANHPVFLLQLAPVNSNTLTSVDSHLCGRDTYVGRLHLSSTGLCLNWKITGPKKNEEIDCFYSI